MEDLKRKNNQQNNYQIFEVVSMSQFIFIYF